MNFKSQDQDATLQNASKLLFWARAAILWTLLIIAAGAVVRASGSGLGCPDWPKCFGGWVPPTQPSELPPEFDAAHFNAVQTWTEYLNRVVGVLLGPLLLIYAYRLARAPRQDHYARLKCGLLLAAATLATAFQAWLGGRVVQTELDGTLITAHFLVAFLILALFQVSAHIWGAAIEGARRAKPPALVEVRLTKLNMLFLLLMGILLVLQVALGSEIRSLIEPLAMSSGSPARQEWIGLLPKAIDFAHRKTALGLVVLAGVFSFTQQKTDARRSAMGFGVSIWLQAGVGISLAYFGFPPIAQGLHVLLCALSVYFYIEIWLAWRNAKSRV